MARARANLMSGMSIVYCLEFLVPLGRSCFLFLFESCIVSSVLCFPLYRVAGVGGMRLKPGCVPVGAAVVVSMALMGLNVLGVVQYGILAIVYKVL